MPLLESSQYLAADEILNQISLSYISISNTVIFFKTHSLHSMFILLYNNTNIMKIGSLTRKFCAFPMSHHFEI